MTVKQLIQNLSKIEDQEVRVMIKGYEGGVNDIDINTPAIIDIALDVNEEWYMGRHERVDDIDVTTNREYHIIKAIILQ
jgi:hypothetical protein